MFYFINVLEKLDIFRKIIAKENIEKVKSDHAKKKKDIDRLFSDSSENKDKNLEIIIDSEKMILDAKKAATRKIF